jgi:uncharacterized protein with HEPN domain
MKDDKLYLIHILECISRIDQYTSPGKDAFLGDTKTQDAVLRNLQILSEPTQRLSPDLKAAHPEVSWDRIAGFRNVLVHEYLGINMVRVWEIVEHGLPGLKQQVEAILKPLQPSP